MIDRSFAPDIRPLLSVPLADPTLEILENDIPLYVFPNNELELIHIQLDIRSGAIYEPKKHLSLFTYSLLKGSHPKYHASEIADLLDFYGSAYDTDVYLDSVSLKMVVPKRNIPNILPIIFEMISAPKYREDYFNIIRQQRIQSLRNNLKKNSFIASRLMLQAMLGNQCAAGQLSTEESYEAITIPDLEQYHRENFCVENITLYCTGLLDKETLDQIRNIFGKISHGQRTLEMPVFKMPMDPSPMLNMEVPDSVQSSICLAMPHLGYADVISTPFKVLSTISGGYFGSRLMQRVREKLGYTYGIGNSFVFLGRQSIFAIQSDVDALHTQEAIDACFSELERLQNEPVSEDELETVKTYITGSLIQEISTSVAYMSKYAFWKKNSTDQIMVQKMLEFMQNIHPEDIIKEAKKYFSYNNFTQIIVGKKLDNRQDV
ncbi:MAG: insulinase family protein [Bacteroidales bacterium]|nr:insulinase family protein [Bacteroidales bacterium]